MMKVMNDYLFIMPLSTVGSDWRSYVAMLQYLFWTVYLKRSSSQSTVLVQRIRGFGDDALYKFTFYITLQ